MPKEEELTQGISKYVFFGMLIALGIASFIVIIPFLSSIIGAAILAYMFYPFYKWVKRNVKHPGIAAFGVAILIILIVTIPLIFLVKNLAQETQYMYIRMKQQLFSGVVIEDHCHDNTFICRSVNNLNSLLRDEKTRNYLIGLLSDFITAVTKRLSDAVVSLPKLMLDLFVTLFATYYFLTDGEQLLARFAKVVPLKVHHQEQVIKQFSDVTHALIYGSFIQALIQGAIAAIGFYLFGISGALGWAVLTSLFSFVPFLGTATIWMPISTFLIISGYVGGESAVLLRGIGLFFYGLFFISTIDNIVKPFIVAGRAHVHPLLILIGVLGGLIVFGLIGAILGPFFLALFQTFLEIYERERKPHLPEKECIIGRTKDGAH